MQCSTALVLPLLLLLPTTDVEYLCLRSTRVDFFFPIQSTLEFSKPCRMLHGGPQTEVHAALAQQDWAAACRPRVKSAFVA